MKNLSVPTALAVLVACSACSSSASSKADRPVPRNAAELVSQYQAQTGFNVTYDERSAEVLQSISVSRVGPDELNTLRIEAPPVASAREASAPGFEVIALRYSEASPLAAALTDLVEAAAGDGDSEIKITTDPRTNSLLVMAPPRQMEKLRVLIATLDKEVRAGE